ncbi:Diacylglycerol kinase eta [Anabarilius grahami]|uniref:Diacylglycerol kinase eta n=1 Tax=Anabarilius grahami TaxID=495550 RepID=A0A3N0Z8Z7_ANAGA|nr:Diacylglycerol kinase eta [Anabarilius grahami]
MTAKRTAFQPLSSSRIPVERKGAAERVHNPECCDSSPQEPEKPAASPSGLPAMGAVGGSGPVVDESSDSEGEQEGPQKLIRKVSTSGQIRSKITPYAGDLLPLECIDIFQTQIS